MLYQSSDRKPQDFSTMAICDSFIVSLSRDTATRVAKQCCPNSHSEIVNGEYRGAHHEPRYTYTD